MTDNSTKVFLSERRRASPRSLVKWDREIIIVEVNFDSNWNNWQIQAYGNARAEKTKNFKYLKNNDFKTAQN